MHIEGGVNRQLTRGLVDFTRRKYQGFDARRLSRGAGILGHARGPFAPDDPRHLASYLILSVGELLGGLTASHIPNEYCDNVAQAGQGTSLV